MNPERLRAWLVVLIRDGIFPLAGAFLCVYLPATHQFESWQLPVLVGLLGVPFVGRGGGSD